MATTTPKAKKALTLHFDMEKETKGTFQFKEPVSGDSRPAVGSIYITKEALASMEHGWTSKGIDVTITVAG